MQNRFALLLGMGAWILGSLGAVTAVADVSRPRIRFGALLGVTAPDFEVKPDFPLTMRQGVSFGGTADFLVSEELWIQTDVLYERSGFTQTSTGNTLQVDLETLRLPVYVKKRGVLNEGRFSLSFYGGPSFGYVNLRRGTLNGATISQTGLRLKSTYLSLDVGVAVEFNVAPKVYPLADFRYQFGISDLDDSASRLFVRHLQAFLGCRFAL